MKGGWEEKKLGDVCKIVNGGTPSTSIKEYWGNDHFWLTPAEMGNLASPYISDTTRKLSNLGLSKCSASIVPPNSVILSSRAPIGYLVINSMPISTNQGCKSFIPSSSIIYKFLYYFLQYKSNYVKSLGSGATFDEVSTTKLSNILISYPKIYEQNRIVSILDTAFEALSQAKTETENNLARANELFQSELTRIFEEKGEAWEEKKLGDVCKVINGGTPSSSIKEYWGNDHLWLTPAEMGNLSSPFINNTTRKLSHLGLLKCSATMVPSYSVILSSRAPIGHLVINSVPISTNQGCKSFVPSFVLNYKFLYFFLLYKISYIKSLGQGATFDEVSKTKLCNIPISFPKKDEQHFIIKKLNNLSSYINDINSFYCSKLDQFAELKQSLLYQAFNGNL
jgi:type I restriction enzyme S subunit